MNKAELVEAIAKATCDSVKNYAYKCSNKVNAIGLLKWTCPEPGLCIKSITCTRDQYDNEITGFLLTSTDGYELQFKGYIGGCQETNGHEYGNVINDPTNWSYWNGNGNYDTTTQIYTDIAPNIINEIRVCEFKTDDGYSQIVTLTTDNLNIPGIGYFNHHCGNYSHDLYITLTDPNGELIIEKTIEI